MGNNTEGLYRCNRHILKQDSFSADFMCALGLCCVSQLSFSTHVVQDKSSIFIFYFFNKQAKELSYEQNTM